MVPAHIACLWVAETRVGAASVPRWSLAAEHGRRAAATRSVAAWKRLPLWAGPDCGAYRREPGTGTPCGIQRPLNAKSYSWWPFGEQMGSGIPGVPSDARWAEILLPLGELADGEPQVCPGRPPKAEANPRLESRPRPGGSPDGGSGLCPYLSIPSGAAQPAPSRSGFPTQVTYKRNPQENEENGDSPFCRENRPRSLRHLPAEPAKRRHSLRGSLGNRTLRPSGPRSCEVRTGRWGTNPWLRWRL